MQIWIQEEGPWWLCSFVFHMVLICSLALIGTSAVVAVVGDAPSFDEAKVDAQGSAQGIEHFELGETPEDAHRIEHRDADAGEAGPDGPGGEILRRQPRVLGRAAGWQSAGQQPAEPWRTGRLRHPGHRPRSGRQEARGAWAESLGDGRPGFGGRGTGNRKAMLGSGGGTRQSERAVAGALNWLARHQMADGSWSLNGFMTRCKDATCTGPASPGPLEIAGTAFGLLPFLAAGQTHDRKGPTNRPSTPASST